jgi:hypothetical protein
MEIIILMAVCLSWLWVEEFQVYRRMDGYLNFKPFNCGLCLSGWFTLLLMCLWNCPLLGAVLQAIGWMAVAMTAFTLLSFGIKKYL